MQAGIDPLWRIAGWVSLLHGFVWLWLLLRWGTFSRFGWNPLALELALSTLPALVPYLGYGLLALFDLLLGFGLLRGIRVAKWAGVLRSLLVLSISLVYYWWSGDFYSACLLFAVAGFLLTLLRGSVAWSLNYPAAMWLFVFFITPMLIVFVVSLGDRSLRQIVTYPTFSLTNLGAYFDDYIRFFSPIQGQYLYLRIFWRSIWLALLNTIICLVVGYPFAYWIARRPAQYRNLLIFLVMIPFWTNFLVRTYAWMLILRDSGIINSFWTSTLHDQAVALAGQSGFFAWLADATSTKLPLLFNQGAVFLGLFYGFLPFVVLPLYSNLEQLDWSLLEAAADLGASTWQTTTRILLPLTMPGIVAAAIIVFIPSLGSYVTPDLMGGGKVSMLGNLLQQQFMTARDWPFGSAIGFIMMAMMLLAILIYFRVGDRSSANHEG